MGRVRCAFEDTANGCGVERGGDNDGGAREGKLADLRGQEVEASMQQPASKHGANERKGVSKQEAAAPGKPVVHQEDKRRQQRDKRQHNKKPANKRETGVKALPLPCTTKTPHNNQMG
jgi:hypothetical protein